MNPRATGILVLIAAALGLFVYLYEIRGEAGRKSAEEAAKRLYPDIEEADLEAIEFTSEYGREIRLERRDGRWRLTRPIDFPADAFSADGLAAALAEIASERVLNQPAAPEVYGLDDGAQVVRFRADGVDHELRLGDETPVGANTYAATGSPEVLYLVATHRARRMSRSLDDLRDKRVLYFDEAAVAAIEATWSDEAVRLERGEESWQLVEPFAYRADADSIGVLLDAIARLRASGFVDEPLPDAALGLAPPELTVTLSLEPPEEGEAPAPLRIAIGETRSDGKRIARGNEGLLYEIDSSALDGFPPRRVVEYQWKEISKFDPAAAQGFEIVFRAVGAEPHTLTAQNDDEGWTTTPDTLEPGRAFGVVSELSNFRANEILAESMGEAELAALGLAPPRVALRVLGDDEDEPLAEVHLGELDPKRGIPAKAADRDTVYRVSYNLAEVIPVSLEAYRNRFVADEPDPEETAAEETAAEEAAAAAQGAADAAEGALE